ncbi:hypothetical protein QFC19_001869 [Naganishia cerealis]|uniref:Uncharacterized protein n=1 Tax=Naganishia cerealis TaxID=610337 RepID=A0ACC2WFC2_9TREE|nr:hypothetical protein QFC19_001869 [Naganishia cerealis]
MPTKSVSYGTLATSNSSSIRVNADFNGGMIASSSSSTQRNRTDDATLVPSRQSYSSSADDHEPGHEQTLVHDTNAVSYDGDHDDREPWQILKRRQGKASVTSGVSNLANTIIGSGALAFPSAFASMGLIPGIFSCAFSGMTSAFGLYLLSRCARQVGRPMHYKCITVEGRASPGKDLEESESIPSTARVVEVIQNPGHESYLNEQEASFNSVALLTFGQGWATRCFDAAIAIKCFGVSISYLIIVKVCFYVLDSVKLAHLSANLDRP